MPPLARRMDEPHKGRGIPRPERPVRRDRTGQVLRIMHQLLVPLSSPLKMSPSPPTIDMLTVLYWMLAPTAMFCVNASRSEIPSAEPFALRAPSGVFVSASPPAPPAPPTVPVVPWLHPAPDVRFAVTLSWSARELT